MTRRAEVLVVAFLLVTMSAPSAVGAGASTDGGVAAATGGSATLGGVNSATLAQQENNTTVVRHRDPDTTDERSDISAVERVLTDQLTEISVNCSEGIRVGDYDACEELDENGSYGDTLSKYVDVTADESGGSGEGESESAESYRDLQREQQEFANETQEFQQTYREYQEAKRNGNTGRARELARELLELREEIQKTGTNISRTAGSVENQTGGSLAPIKQNTESVSADVTNTTNTVTSDVFRPTTISVSRERSGNSSARRPLVVEGQVQTTNGTRVSNGSVVLATGPGLDARIVERTRTELDSSGSYQLSYQPTAIRTGSQTLLVRYVPPAGSVYRSADETVQTTIESIEATVSFRSANETARYQKIIGGVATLEPTGPDTELALRDVPLSLSVYGKELARGQTDSNGSTLLRGALPAGVPPGPQTIIVRGPSSGRAVTIQPVRQEINIRPSTGKLDARAVQTAAAVPRIRVVGHIRARQVALPGQAVAVRIGGQQVGTLQTNATGHFRGTVPIPNASFPETGQRSLAVVVAFDGSETNIESTSIRQEISVQSGVAPEPESLGEQVLSFVDANPLVVGSGVGVMMLVASAVAIRRRTSESETERKSFDRTEGSTTGAGGDGDSTRTKFKAPNIEVVQHALSEGAYARAILTGYASVRQGHPAPDNSATHWEFYQQAVESDLPQAKVDALREVTEGFERVSFAGQPPTEDEATAVIEAVRQFLDQGEEPSIDPVGADD